MEFYSSLPVAPGTLPETISEPHNSEDEARRAGETRRGKIIPSGGRINYAAIIPPQGEPIVIVDRLH
jgi:hypothetical protein